MSDNFLESSGHRMVEGIKIFS